MYIKLKSSNGNSNGNSLIHSTEGKVFYCDVTIGPLFIRLATTRARFREELALVLLMHPCSTISGTWLYYEMFEIFAILKANLSSLLMNFFPRQFFLIFCLQKLNISTCFSGGVRSEFVPLLVIGICPVLTTSGESSSNKAQVSLKWLKFARAVRR